MNNQVKRVSEYVAFIGLGGLIVLSMVIIFDILGRELFGLPIPGFSDITEQLIIVTAAACFPASFADRSHVAVRFLGQITHWRMREGLDFIGHALTLAVLCVIAYQLYFYAIDVWVNNETTWLIGLPIWPIWWLVTGLFICSFIVQLVITVLQLKRVFAPVALPDRDTVATEKSDAGAHTER